MVRLLLGVLLLLPTSASALEAVNCRLAEYEVPPLTLIECEVTNDSTTAVAVLQYDVDVTGSGRAVPWGKAKNRRSDVSGGIEPGEVVTVLFSGPSVPERVTAPLTYIVRVTQAFDVNGEPILR